MATDYPLERRREREDRRDLYAVPLLEQWFLTYGVFFGGFVEMLKRISAEVGEQYKELKPFFAALYAKMARSTAEELLPRTWWPTDFSALETDESRAAARKILKHLLDNARMPSKSEAKQMARHMHVHWQLVMKYFECLYCEINDKDLKNAGLSAISAIIR